VKDSRQRSTPVVTPECRHSRPSGSVTPVDGSTHLPVTLLSRGVPEDKIGIFTSSTESTSGMLFLGSVSLLERSVPG
jgi:hypothetical protein